MLGTWEWGQVKGACWRQLDQSSCFAYYSSCNERGKQKNKITHVESLCKKWQPCKPYYLATWIWCKIQSSQSMRETYSQARITTGRCSMLKGWWDWITICGNLLPDVIDFMMEPWSV
jgi:hypothetical protein